jgi:hypothetical protein
MEDANWVYVSGLRYQKLDCVGRGGSSKVFKVGITGIELHYALLSMHCLACPHVLQRHVLNFVHH